jgi:hypothetical protein
MIAKAHREYEKNAEWEKDEAEVAAAMEDIKKYGPDWAKSEAADVTAKVTNWLPNAWAPPSSENPSGGGIIGWTPYGLLGGDLGLIKISQAYVRYCRTKATGLLCREYLVRLCIHELRHVNLDRPGIFEKDEEGHQADEDRGVDATKESWESRDVKEAAETLARKRAAESAEKSKAAK